MHVGRQRHVDIDRVDGGGPKNICISLSTILSHFYSNSHPLTTTWQPLGYHLATTWLPLGYHLATIWLPFGYHLAARLNTSTRALHMKICFMHVHTNVRIGDPGYRRGFRRQG